MSPSNHDLQGRILDLENQLDNVKVTLRELSVPLESDWSVAHAVREWIVNRDERIKHLEDILVRAVETVNVPGTTFSTLPAAINAKLMERDSIIQARGRDLEATKARKQELENLLASATEELEDSIRERDEKSRTHCWVTIKEWGDLNDENRHLKAKLDAAEREAFEKALKQRHPFIEWQSDFAQGAWTAWKLSRNLPD